MAPKRRASKKLAGVQKTRRTPDDAEIDDSIKSAQVHDETQPSQNGNTSSENCPILTLPSACLLKIFLNMVIWDLLAVSKCCRRFRALANVAAKESLQTESFTYIYSDVEAKAFMSRFARFMHDIVAGNAPRPPDSHNHPADRNATGWLRRCKSLRTLKLYNMELNCGWECSGTLRRLENLTLSHCKLNELNYHKHGVTMQACKNLKSIAIINEITAPASYVCRELLMYITGLAQIERISFDVQHFELSDSSFTEHIAERLARLKKLKSLSLNLVACTYTTFIETLCDSESLEELHLTVDILNDEVPEALDKFPNLRSCEIVYKPLLGDLLLWISKVSKLENEMTTFDVSDIVDTDGKLSVTLKRKFVDHSAIPS